MMARGRFRLPRLRDALAFTTLVVTAAMLTTGLASAAPPDAVGWWHRAVADPLAGGVSLPDDARPTLVPVPNGGLYVANDASGPRAIAALRFPSATGSAILTLQVSGEPFLPMGARLMACPVVSTWQSVENGSWEARPNLNCDRATEAAFEEDGSEIRFELSNLDDHGSPLAVEVAITPADDEVVPFAIAFKAPTDKALQAATGAPAVSAPSEPDPQPSGSALPPATTTVPPLDASERTDAMSRTTRPANPVMAPPSEAPASAATPTPARQPEPHLSVGRLPGISTHGTGRAALTALVSLLAAAAWLTSGGPPKLRSGSMPSLSRRKLNQEVRP